jgi:Organic solute transport protein 1
MSSQHAMPMQVLGVASEMIFVLENKLNGHRDSLVVPARKCDIVLEDVAKAVFSGELFEDLFKPHRRLSLHELRTILRGAIDASAIKIESVQFEKVHVATTGPAVILRPLEKGCKPETPDCLTTLRIRLQTAALFPSTSDILRFLHVIESATGEDR